MNVKYSTEDERKQAVKERNKNYYLKNRDRIRQKTKDYYESHKTIITIEPIEGEIWKPIIDWEGLYECSNYGRIKSLWKNKIINGSLDEDGYIKITLTKKDGIQVTERKCRLIGKTWIPNPYNKPEIDHINTIRTDDRVSNLRWVTSKENKENPQTIENRKNVDYGFNRGKHREYNNGSFIMVA